MKFPLWIPLFRRWYDAMVTAESAAADWQSRFDALSAEMRELRAEYTADLKKIADFEAVRGTGRNVFARASETDQPSAPVVQPKGFRTAREAIWERERELRDAVVNAHAATNQEIPS